MTVRYADAHYYIALLSREDQHHAAALRLTAQLEGTIVTTDWILAEVGNALCQPRNRLRFIELVNVLRSNPAVKIVSATREIFDGGLQLYANRPDKAWSLVDCISFLVMEREGIREALTADLHFEQAGFAALLK